MELSKKMKKEGKKYLQGKFSKISQEFMVITCLIAMPFFLYLIVSYFFDIIKDNGKSLDTFILLLILFFFWFSRVFLLLPKFLNIFPLLIVNEQGIWVRVFNIILCWKFIPWSKIRSIKKASFTYYRWGVWLIGIDSYLTIWHKYIAFGHDLRDTPYLFVSDYMNDIDEFVLKVAEVTGDDITEELII